jgi:hypothetical protein
MPTAVLTTVMTTMNSSEIPTIQCHRLTGFFGRRELSWLSDI